MPNSRGVVWGLLGATILALALWQLGDPKDDRRPVSEADALELREATEELRAARALLEREALARARTARGGHEAVAEAARTEGTATNDGASQDGDSPAEDSAAQSAEPATEEERARHAEHTFAAQPIDDAWAQEARESLRGAFAALPQSPVGVQDVECRTTLCRVKLDSAPDDDARDYVSAFVRSGSWGGSGMVVREPGVGEGTTTAVLYLAVEGEDPPDSPETLVE